MIDRDVRLLNIWYKDAKKSLLWKKREILNKVLPTCTGNPNKFKSDMRQVNAQLQECEDNPGRDLIKKNHDDYYKKLGKKDN